MSCIDCAEDAGVGCQGRRNAAAGCLDTRLQLTPAVTAAPASADVLARWICAVNSVKLLRPSSRFEHAQQGCWLPAAVSIKQTRCASHDVHTTLLPSKQLGSGRRTFLECINSNRAAARCLQADHVVLPHIQPRLLFPRLTSWSDRCRQRSDNGDCGAYLGYQFTSWHSCAARGLSRNM